MLGDGRQAVFDAAHIRPEGLGERQAHHGQRAVGFDVEQALDERAAPGIGQRAVDDEDLRHAIAILAEIGDHEGLPVLGLAETEAGLIELGNGGAGFLGVRAHFEADGGDQRARRRETIAEGMLGHFGTEPLRHRPIPEIGGEFRVALPAQRAGAQAMAWWLASLPGGETPRVRDSCAMTA